MEAVKYLSLALVGVATVLGVRSLIDIGSDRGSVVLSAYGKWISDELDKVLIEVSPVQASIWVVLAVAAGAVLGVMAGNSLGPRVFFVIVLSTGAYFLPTFAVQWLKARYLQRVDDQLVDALRLMSNALKAGLNLQQAIELASR